MLVTLIPLFDENMTVKAYSLFTQKDKYLMNQEGQAAGQNEVTTAIEGLDVIKTMGVDTFSGTKEIFVTLNLLSIFTKFEDECGIPPEQLVFLIDNTLPPEDIYINRLKDIKRKGYKLAIRKLEIRQYQQYQEILKIMDYMFFDYKKMDISRGRLFFTKQFPHIKLCAGNLDTRESFEKLKAQGGYRYYEGPFYRVPVTQGQHKVVPLKVNYIELLNLVNKDDYELKYAADIITRDTALAISLLKLVNKFARNSEIVSIKYAAAALGQKELRRWINTVVTNQLYSNKPNEITRLSLLRAKFAENLAPFFGLAMQASELFLMGLFSVVDLIFEMPMSEALEKLKLSAQIRDALVNHHGGLDTVYEFLLCYENANWQEVAKILSYQHIDTQDVYKAYMQSLGWYRDLIT